MGLGDGGVVFGVFALAAEEGELGGKEAVCRGGEERVLGEDLFCEVSGLLEVDAVFGEGGYVEVYGKAALGGAFNVSGAAHLHIFFCKNKSVRCGAHEFQAFAALSAEFVAAH